MQQRFLAVLMALAATGCAARMADQTDPTPIQFVHIVAALPQFDADSATHDASSSSLYAITGTVADFESGQPLGSSEIIIRLGGDGKIVSTMTDSRGGFVLPHIPPGQYGLIVRRLGYTSLSDLRVAQPGAIDTLRLKMIKTVNRIQNPGGRSST